MRLISVKELKKQYEKERQEQMAKSGDVPRRLPKAKGGKPSGRS